MVKGLTRGVAEIMYVLGELSRHLFKYCWLIDDVLLSEVPIYYLLLLLISVFIKRMKRGEWNLKAVR